MHQNGLRHIVSVGKSYGGFQVDSLLTGAVCSIMSKFQDMWQTTDTLVRAAFKNRLLGIRLAVQQAKGLDGSGLRSLVFFRWKLVISQIRPSRASRHR